MKISFLCKLIMCTLGHDAGKMEVNVVQVIMLLSYVEIIIFGFCVYLASYVEIIISCCCHIIFMLFDVVIILLYI